MQSNWEIRWEIPTTTKLSFPAITLHIWRKKAKWGHGPDSFTVGSLADRAQTPPISSPSSATSSCPRAQQLGVWPLPEQQLLHTSRAQHKLPLQLMDLDTDWTCPLCNQLAKESIPVTLQESHCQNRVISLKQMWMSQRCSTLNMLFPCLQSHEILSVLLHFKQTSDKYTIHHQFPLRCTAEDIDKSFFKILLFLRL